MVILFNSSTSSNVIYTVCLIYYLICMSQSWFPLYLVCAVGVFGWIIRLYYAHWFRLQRALIVSIELLELGCSVRERIRGGVLCKSPGFRLSLFGYTERLNWTTKIVKVDFCVRKFVSWSSIQLTADYWKWDHHNAWELVAKAFAEFINR